MTAPEGCKGVNADGEPCRSPPQFVGEDGYCKAHRPGGQEEMKRLAYLGGAASKAKREPPKLEEDVLPPLEGHASAKAWLEIIGRAVLMGRIERDQADPANWAVREWIAALDTHLEELECELDGRPRLRREK